MKQGLLYKAAIIATAIFVTACTGNEKDFDAMGTFEATEITVSAESAGRIMTFDVIEGDHVTASQEVGCIDSLQLYLSKLQLLQNAASVRSNRPDIAKQVASLKEQLTKQRKEQARVEKLLLSNAATQKQLDDITSAIIVLESQLAATESTLRNSAAGIDAQSSAIDIQVAQIDDKIAKCHIASPIDGIVLSKYTQAGELSVVGKPLFKVADIRNMYLRAYFTLGQLKDIKIGQKVTVKANFGGNNDREYTGTIIWISDKNEFTPKTILTKNDRENLVYAVKIAIENDGYVKIGMYGEVKL